MNRCLNVSRFQGVKVSVFAETFKPSNLQTVLSLAELESLSCLRTSRLLALDRACVAREQAEVAQLAAVAFIDLHERASNSETQRARLTGLPAALEIRLDVVPTQRIRRREWLLNRAHERRAREVIAQRPAIHIPLARANLQIHAAHRFLAAANRVDVLRVRHLLLVLVEGER